MNEKTKQVASDIEVIIGLIDASPETKNLLRRLIDQYGKCRNEEGAIAVARPVVSVVERIMGWDDDDVPF